MHIFAAQLIDWLVWRSFSKRSGNIFHQFHFHNCNMTSVKKREGRKNLIETKFWARLQLITLKLWFYTKMAKIWFKNFARDN